MARLTQKIVIIVTTFTIAIFIPCLVFFLAHPQRKKEGIICLLLQILIITHPLASIWAIWGVFKYHMGYDHTKDDLY